MFNDNREFSHNVAAPYWQFSQTMKFLSLVVFLWKKNIVLFCKTNIWGLHENALYFLLSKIASFIKTSASLPGGLKMKSATIAPRDE